MKKIPLFAALSLLLASCAISGRSTYMLRGVKSTGVMDTTNISNEKFIVKEYANVEYNYYSTGDPTIKIEDVRSTYENDDFFIVWHIDGVRLNFTLTNKTEDILRVKWQDAAFVHIDNYVRKVYHEGMKYADKSPFIPDMIVPSGAIYEDFVLPINKAYWNGASYSEAPLLNTKCETRKDFEKLVLEYTGRELSVVLPIETNGVLKYYNFVFYIDKISNPFNVLR